MSGPKRHGLKTATGMLLTCKPHLSVPNLAATLDHVTKLIAAVRPYFLSVTKNQLLFVP